MNSEYSKYLTRWNKMYDTFDSEEHMKQRALSQSSGMFTGTAKLSPIIKFDQYLRPTDGMRRNKSHGYQRWTDYIYRAVWYAYPLESHDQALGMIENEPPVIELPPQLEYMKVDAADKHESLEKVLSITNSEQLKVSRIGSLISVTDDPQKPFNIAFYKAKAIQDWHEIIDKQGDKVLDWVKLLTSEMINDKPVYLILYIEQDGFYSQYKTTNEDAKCGEVGLSDEGYIQDSYIEPRVSEKPTATIPLVITNVQRLGTEIEDPFLESVSDKAIKLFQASATLEDTLYWGGQSTLFTQNYGDDKNPIKIGNGAVNNSTSDTVYAEYATAGVDGIAPNRENVDKLKEDCVSLGFDLVNQGVESGTALDTRTAIKTAKLKTLAKTSANGLAWLLRQAAEWIGANPDEVIVTANTSFSDTQYTADDIQKFGLAVMSGNMLKEDLYSIMKKQELTSIESFNDWNLALLDSFVGEPSEPNL